MPKEPDVLTIEYVLALRADKLKRDKEAIAAFPCLLERLSQYVKNRGPKCWWCLNCYITKKQDSRVNGGGNMYRGGGAKMYHGLGGSLSA